MNTEKNTEITYKALRIANVMRWVAVEESLPPHLKPCLVWNGNSYYTAVLNRAGGLNVWCARGCLISESRPTTTK